MKYIATFYSHFGAIKFKKYCETQNITAKLMPVPRDLSSSCGTCVLFERDLFNDDDIEKIDKDELERIVSFAESGYSVLYKVQ